MTQQVHGHRGRSNNDSWAYRRLLLRGARHLLDKQWRRLRALFATDDPTGEIQAAWAGKELLRQLLDALPASGGPLVLDPRRDPDPASRRIDAWWPAIEAYLRLRVTNARTEGYNRKIKQIKPVSCGFRNQQSYERRIMLHNAATEA